MNIITIRSDNPLAEIGLFSDQIRVEYVTWEAHRQLAETLHTKLKELLDSQNLSWSDVDGIACYEGPGSFTGLRIGLSVANALASSLRVPVASSTGDGWIELSISKLLEGKGQQVVLPEYGQSAHITQPRK